MKKVLCFGEILLRMSPVLSKKWIENAAMSVHVGGSELNVAKALSAWGIPVAFCSALPDNYLVRELLDDLQQQKMDISRVSLSGNRFGIYYLPESADLKNQGVIYDRAYSAFSELKPGSIDWDEVFNGIDWFHFSAINPALNAGLAQICREALEAATQKGLTISVDLNDRTKLWQYGQHPSAIMPGLVQYCDIVMGNIWSAHRLLGIAIDPDLPNKATVEAYLHQGEETSNDIVQKFPKCTTVAHTFRFEIDNGIQYFASLKNASGFFASDVYHQQSVISKIGTGDCFMAALIYGLLKSQQPQEIVDFAAAAAIGKMQEKGDATHQSIEDVQKMVNKWTKTLTK